MNHFRNLIVCSTFFLPLHAGVVEFFDPNREESSNTIYSNLFYLMASDPISLYGMFHDWSGDYHPQSGENIAIQDMRFDIGTRVFEDYYLGYFYRYNVHIKTGKDFTDFFYHVKNHIDLDPNKIYELNLNIQGIKQSGLILSKNQVVFDNGEDSLTLGASVSLTVGHDMQHGSIRGQAQAVNEKSYQASGEVSSYYTYNYLYDLDVNKASAYGYGTDLALTYKNKKHKVALNLIVNDLESKMYWKNLPYSLVDIDTENQSFDEDGYIHYSPTITGIELYRDFTQKIEPRYRVEGSKEIKKNVTILVGTDYLYDEYFPYIVGSKLLDNAENFALSYEHRFKSFGVEYQHQNFSLGVISDGVQDISVFGLKGAFSYQF